MRRTCLLWVVAASVSCGGSAPSNAPAATSAAKVQGAKPEIDVATITLSAESEKRLGLQTLVVAEGAVTATRTIGGEAVVAPGRNTVVSAPVAGMLMQPPAGAPSIGPVARGRVLFTLVPVQASDRDLQTGAEREAREANARLLLADQRLQRLEALLKEGAASTRSVEEARTERAIADSAAAAAKQRLETAGRLPRGARDELALTAPFDGEITALRAAAGQTVPAGAPVAEIAQVDALWIRVPVFAGDARSFDMTKPARVAPLGRESSGAWLDATRVAGPPSASLDASSVDFYFRPARPGSFRPGERVSVQLEVASAASARSGIVIPESAIIRDLQGGAWVYEQRAAHVFARRRVELGDPTGSGALVLRGLVPGVRIVTVGVAELYGTEFYVSK